MSSINIYHITNTFTQDVRVDAKLCEKITTGWLGKIELTSPGTKAYLIVEATLYNHIKEDADDELLETTREYIHKLSHSNPRHKFTMYLSGKYKGVYYPKD